MIESHFFSLASLWLHLIAATVWTGALAFFLFAFLPAARALPPGGSLRAFEHGRRALQTLSWTAIQLLLVTGALNFYFRFTAGADPGGFYIGTLGIKLLLFGAMIFHHSLQAFKYGPQIAAAAECGAEDAWPEPLADTIARWSALLKINTGIGVVNILLGLLLSGR
jgi:copper resistance protein D